MLKRSGALDPAHVWLVHDVNHDAIFDHWVRDHVRQQLHARASPYVSRSHEGQIKSLVYNGLYT